MTDTIHCQLAFRSSRRGRSRLHVAAEPDSTVNVGRVPRVTRLLALAYRFEELIRAHEIVDYAELARLGHVSRARLTQIMNLRLLASDIQEAILFLPRIERGSDPIHLWQLQPIAKQLDWRKQRSAWRKLVRPDLT